MHIYAMKLADYLAHAALTDQAFADKIGMSQSAVNRLRRGETRPDWETASKIAHATDGAVTANDFMPENPTPPTSHREVA